MSMVHTFEINGLRVQSGDILCTVAGDKGSLRGAFWRLVGKLVPGAVDHVIVYVGPQGRCVEAGPKGVVVLDLEGSAQDGQEARRRRGAFMDRLYGVAYPLRGRGLSRQEKAWIRGSVVSYCLAQAAAKKPYNLNLFDPWREDAFYCSQLAYRAYLGHGIDLNSGLGVPNVGGIERIVFPQEIWSGCAHQRARRG